VGGGATGSETGAGTTGESANAAANAQVIIWIPSA
jgi:hypothetical protein